MSNEMGVGVKIDDKGAIKSLENLDKTAKETSKSIGALGKTSTETGKDMEKAFNTSKVGRSITSLKGNIVSLSKALGPVGTAAIIAAVAIGGIAVAAYKAGSSIMDFTNNMAENADEIGKAAQRMDVTIEFYQKMASAAEHAGTSMTTMETAMRTLLRSITMVSEGNVRTTETFEDLGVSIYDSNGEMRDQQDIFADTLIQLSKMENHTERNARAQKILGKSASLLAPIFNEGEEAVRGYIEANESAVVVSEDMAKASARYNDAMQTLKESFKKGFTDKLTPFIEMMAALSEAFDPADVERFGNIFGSVVKGILNYAVYLVKGLLETKVKIQNIFTGFGASIVGAMLTIKKNVIIVVNSIGTLLDKKATAMAKLNLGIVTMAKNANVIGVTKKSVAEAQKAYNRMLNIEKDNVAQRKTLIKSIDAEIAKSTGVAATSMAKRTEGLKKFTKIMDNFINGISNVDISADSNDGTDNSGGSSDGGNDDSKASSSVAKVSNMQNVLAKIFLNSIKDKYKKAEILEIRRYNQVLKEIDLEIKSEETKNKAIEDATRNHTDNLKQIESEKNAALKAEREQAEKDEYEALMNRFSNITEAIQLSIDLASPLFDMFTAIADAAVAADQRRLDSWVKTEREKLSSSMMSDRSMRAAQKKIAKEAEKQQKEIAKKEARIKIASTWMNAFGGAATAFATAMQLGPIAGPIVGGINAAAVLTTAGIQTAAMKDQMSSFQDGGVYGGFNGVSYGKDDMVATVKKGEMNLNGPQQRELYDIANGKGGNGLSLHIENFSGGDSELSRLEELLITLQSNGRIKEVI